MTAVPAMAQAVSFRDSNENGFAVFSRASEHALFAGSWRARKAEFEIGIAPFFPSVADDLANPVYLRFYLALGRLVRFKGAH
jgi:hypothetical protein